MCQYIKKWQKVFIKKISTVKKLKLKQVKNNSRSPKKNWRAFHENQRESCLLNHICTCITYRHGVERLLRLLFLDADRGNDKDYNDDNNDGRRRADDGGDGCVLCSRKTTTFQ